MIWTLTKKFGYIQKILDESKLVNWTYLFWTGPKCFGTDPKHIFITEFHILNQVQKIWSCPKQFGPVQNNFGQIEGQGIECTVLI